LVFCLFFLLLASPFAIEAKRKDKIKRKGHEAKAPKEEKEIKNPKQDGSKLLLQHLGDAVERIKGAGAENPLAEQEGLAIIQLLASCTPEVDTNTWKDFWFEALTKKPKALAVQLETLFHHLEAFPEENSIRKNATLAAVYALDNLSRQSPTRAFVTALVTPQQKGAKLANRIIDLMEQYNGYLPLQIRLQLLFSGVIILQQVQAPGLNKIVDRVYKNLELHPAEPYMQRSALMLLASVRKAYEEKSIADDLYRGLHIVKKFLDEGAFSHNENLQQFATDYVKDVASIHEDAKKEEL